jgi:hypothetical protein
MRPRAAIVTPLLFLATLLPLSAANADSITILGGSMVVTEQLIGPLPTIDIHGTRGFALHGIPEVLQSPGPWNCRPCDMRFGLEIATVQGGSDLPGFVEFEGIRYAQGLQDASLILFFVGGPVPLPPLSESAVVSGEFQVNGNLNLPDVNGEPVPGIPVFGRGTATVELVRNSGGEPVWEFKHARYEFESAATIPEPGTIFLVGGGLIATVCGRKGRTAFRVRT